MATRQYIGARYVIKIYENSVTPNSAEWESSTSYEPLTMVTYQNSSYISKKAVPATVGNPADNPAYWVISGAYNGQIADLQNKVAILESGFVNVLTLGVKNDGSADCSDIINANNDKPLYFPAGTYRFDHTINLKHSIYGEGIPVEWRQRNFDGTTFIFTMTDTSNAIEYTDSSVEAKSISISNICIEVDYAFRGIGIYLHTAYTRFNISDVSLINIRGIGIKADPTVGSSRYLRANNVTIWGVSGSTVEGSIGVSMESYAYDSILENLNIGGIQKCIIIKNGCGNCLISNCHLWCGGGNPTAAYYNATTCLELHASTRVIGAFLDSACIPVKLDDGVTLQLDNCFIMWDNIALYATYNAPTLFHSGTGKSRVIVGDVRVAMPFATSYINNAYVQMTKMPLINYIGYTVTRNRCVWSDSGEAYSLQLIRDSSDEYQLVVRCTDHCSFFLQFGNINVLVSVDAGRLEYTSISGFPGTLAWKLDSTSNLIEVYLLTAATEKVLITPLSRYIVDYNRNMEDNMPLTIKKQSDATGLTAGIVVTWRNP